MQLEKGDVRQELSRRTQDFHEGDPAIQAALRGEKFFDVTPGHLVSAALETDYFETLEECLDFFGLERTALKRSEPFESWEIREFESRILADADMRLRPAAEAPFEAWAEQLIEAGTLDEADRSVAIEALLAVAEAREPSDETIKYADELEDEGHHDGSYHPNLLELQTFRLLQLLEREGFAVTVTAAADSLVSSGFINKVMEDVGIIDPDYREMMGKLGTVAFHGLRHEVEAGLIDPDDFGSEDWEQPYEDIIDDDFTHWTRQGHPAVLSARDLRLFASHYASPSELPEIVEDEKYKRLVALVKNTPERIKEVQASVSALRDK